MSTIPCLSPDGSIVHLTGVRWCNGKYFRYMDLDRDILWVKCSMTAKSGSGKPCKYYANGSLDGTPLCSGHFPPFAPKQVAMKCNVVQLDECEDVECPVCMEDFIAIESAMCGHKVCMPCCRRMKASGRTPVCPMCRDPRFKSLVDLSILR